MWNRWKAMPGHLKNRWIIGGIAVIAVIVVLVVVTSGSSNAVTLHGTYTDVVTDLSSLASILHGFDVLT